MKWLKIKGYENYSISDTGYVRNDKTKRVLAFNYNGAGYRRVCLSKEGKQKYPFVHRLVYETFMNTEIPKGMVIDHIDNNKLNNRLDNLQVITFKQNLTKEYGRKPNKYRRYNKQERELVVKQLKQGISPKIISQQIGISYSYLCRIKNQQLWG